MSEKKVGSEERDDVAVVGMGLRFPGAGTQGQFWDNLVRGVDLVSEIPPSRWDTEAYYSAEPNAADKSVSKWGGLLDAIDRFDHRFFNLSPREARNMDPQQRLLLEECWHCVEDSGIPVNTLQGARTSVFVGVMAVDYHQQMTASSEPVDGYACLGNYGGILANRLSYFLGLQGRARLLVLPAHRLSWRCTTRGGPCCLVIVTMRSPPV